ncbi:uncharacterized protein LOC116268372 [Nymphaea colorata]|uniref:uncharacterized protein LOC116268372 n=1 Tax=Nymphaea colorata TaxID=210225 RepID=UPI00129DF528|nr:uncharacterized protein LOC116268372 [Nymphaea colorata]
MDEQMLSIKHKVKRYLTEVAQYSRKDPNSLRHIENPTFGIFYKVHNYVVFTVIADKSYPLNWQAPSSTPSSRPSSTRKIKEKKREFEDPGSVKNVDRMKRELEAIHNIMKENMSMLEGRQEDLQQTS